MQRKHSVSTIAQGQAGVYQVLAELILRGFRPYLPASDIGVDILLEQGIRIQVKTTMRPSTHHRLRDGTFLFSLAPARQVGPNNTVKLVPARVFSGTCDFVVMWAIEPNRFWIVPSAVLDGRHTATISPVRQWRDFDKAQVETMKAQGLSISEIARQLGVAPRTVTRRQTTFQSLKRKDANLQSYEDRWDLITQALAMLTEANAVVGPASKPAVIGVEPKTISEA